MKRIIKSSAIILVVISAVGVFTWGATSSFFSDQETSTGNTFTAGAIDLKIDSQCSYNGQPSSECGNWSLKDLDPAADKFFNFSDIKPGDFGENTISLHVINNDAWACLTIDNLKNDENGCNEPEIKAGDTTCGAAPDQGELAQNLFFTAWVDDGDNIWESGEPLLFSNKSGPASDILNGKTYALADATTGDGPILGGDLQDASKTKSIGLKWCFGTMTVDEDTHTISCDGSGVGNISQTDSLTADVEFYVIQSKNNPNFVCSGINGSNGEPACTPTAEVCTGGIDEDCDGYIDCGDSDCVNDQACQITTNTRTMRLENKDGNWNPIIDGTYGDLTYSLAGPTFDYSFKAYGLMSGGHYNLIYYPDPWGSPKTIVLIGGTIIADSTGNIDTGNQSVELGMDLPNSTLGFDNNYPAGAKVWLVPSANLSGNQFNWTGITNLLLEMGWVNYDDTDVVSVETIALHDLGASSQYGYYHSYAGANVTFAYTTPADNKLSGTVTATGLKLYATYQLKFEGQPTCKYGVSGDDAVNEKIGYMGRWWDNTANSNTNDAGYLANSIYHGGTHCISGYLVWGYITADSSGNASKVVTTDSSYHVLWAGGGVCNTSANTYLAYLDPAHPTIWFSPADKVDGQIERGSCGSFTFDSGDYKLGMILNEESFHQSPGTWTAVMGGDINFKILP